MNTKLLLAVAALGALGLSQTAFADAAPAPTPEFTVTGDAALVSQYRFRGLTNSDNRPAVQMAMTITDKSGFYLSTWGSSTTNNLDTPINTGGTEIDLYGGYSHTFKDGITADGGVYGYIYPGAPAVAPGGGPSTSLNYFEVYGDLSKSFGPIGTKVGINWAPKQAAFDAAATHYSMYEYFELTYSPASIPALGFHSHIGHTGGAENYGKEYMDYVVGAGYKWKNLTFDISVTGTNISHTDAANDVVANGFGTTNYWYRPAKAVPVFSVTANF